MDYLARLAGGLRSGIGISPSDIVRAPAFVAPYLGRDVIFHAPELRTASDLAIVGGQYRLLLRELGPQANEPLAEAFVRVVLRHVYGTAADTPANAKFLAAELLVPLAALRRHAGKTVPQLARLFGLSEATMSRRLVALQRSTRTVVTRRDGVRKARLRGCAMALRAG